MQHIFLIGARRYDEDRTVRSVATALYIVLFDLDWKCGFLGVIGTEFVAEKRSSCAAPTLDAVANNSKGLTAVSAFRCAIFDFANVNTHSCLSGYIHASRENGPFVCGTDRSLDHGECQNRATAVDSRRVPFAFLSSPTVLPESSSTTRSRSPK
jgi:hypothetical protein